MPGAAPSFRQRCVVLGMILAVSGALTMLHARPSTPADRAATNSATETIMDHQAQERVRETKREPSEIKEGPATKAVERRTARVPSAVFLWAAGASILGSLILQLTGRRKGALFVGQWAPTFLLLGVYNKQVKTQGHD